MSRQAIAIGFTITILAVLSLWAGCALVTLVLG